MITSSKTEVEDFQKEVERRVQQHFIGHVGDIITPKEWRDCVMSIVFDMLPAESDYVKLISQNTQLQKQVVDLTTQVEDTKAQYTLLGRQQHASEDIAALESYIAHVSPDSIDYKDVRGIKKAILIIQRGV